MSLLNTTGGLGGAVSSQADPGQSPGGVQGSKPLEALRILYSILPEIVKKTHSDSAIFFRQVDNEILEGETDNQATEGLSVEQEGIVQNIYVTEDDYQSVLGEWFIQLSVL